MSSAQNPRAALDVRPRKTPSLLSLEDNIKHQIAVLKMDMSVLKVSADRLDAYVQAADRILKECQEILSPRSLELFPEAS